MSEDYDCPEDHAYFIGCTCDHEPEEHGWAGCEADGCPCEGNWEY